MPAAATTALLSDLGGGLAIVFIVLLAFGILALTLIYVASAVVVLERFARVATRWRVAIPFAALAAALASAVSVRIWVPEAASLPQTEWLNYYATLCGLAFLGGLAAMAGLRLLLRRLPPLGLRAALVVVLAIAGGAVLGSGGPGLLASAGTATASVLFAVVLLGLLPLAATGLVDMRQSAEWFIAIRYLVARRRQVFISAITAICVAGIAAGVWLIIVVLSVMNGFEKTWRDEIVGNRAHFTVHSRFGSFDDFERVLSEVRNTPGVTGASAYLDAEGLVRGSRGEIASVRVRGIDPDTVGLVTDLPDDIVRGSLAALSAPPTRPAEAGVDLDAADPGLIDPAIVVGNQLAMRFGVGLGDPLLLISPYGGVPTPMGPAPRLQRFRVVGVFESSFFQYDEIYTYVTLAAAQDFRHAGDVVDGIEARTTDIYRSRAVAREVEKRLQSPGFYTRDWKEFFPAFFQALKSERIMMFVLLTMIMVVAAFVIVATLIMMIMEKSADIAILKAMGAEDATIERIFAIEGTLMGLAGTLLGVVAGIAVTQQLAWIQDQIERVTGIDTLPASVYQFSTLPSEVDPLQIGLVAAIAMVLSLGATLLPSRQGARLDPAESLRYE